MVYDVQQNTINNIVGLFNGIFEKNIYTYNNTIVELYNYNFQKLIQPNNNPIMVLLLLILLFLILLITKNIKIQI